MDTDIISSLELYANQAIAFAKKSNVSLDYSNESIQHVEKLLADLHEEQKKLTIPEEIIGQAATSFGVYVGMTFIKNLQKGEWKFNADEKLLYIEIEDEAVFFPAKAFRRIKEGEGDNIVSLYMAAYNKHSPVPITLNLHG